MLVQMNTMDLAGHISRQLLHTDTHPTIDFYMEYDADRNWKNGGYRIAYTNFVNADMILINRHEGGMLMGIDCKESKELKSLQHFLDMYFQQESIPQKVWVEVSEKITVITHGGKLANVYTSDPNMAVTVIDGHDDPDAEADVLREFSCGNLHELY